MTTYKLELIWRADAEGNGVQTRLYLDDKLIQSSFHPTHDVVEAAENAMCDFLIEAIKKDENAEP